MKTRKEIDMLSMRAKLWPPHYRRASALAALVAGLTLLITGCGSSAGTAVANLGATPTSTPSSSSHGSGRTGMLAYAACMRSHGVPNFPDPGPRGDVTIRRAYGIDPSSPSFQAAQKTCQKELPNGGKASPAEQAQMQQQALRYSACIRSHGVPNFPDPQFSGGQVLLAVRNGSAINPNSPTFQAAQQACQKYLSAARGGSR
jgi:hypothetical protein